MPNRSGELIGVNYFLESSLPVLMAGAIALTIASIVYFSTRSRGSQMAVGAIVFVTGAGVLLERLIETPREQVETTLQELLDAIESNDVSGVLTFLSPQAVDVRSDAETLMPRLEIEKANNTGDMAITLDNETNPTQATIKFTGFILATDIASGMRGAYHDGVTVVMERSGERWLVRECIPEKNWRREANKLRRSPSSGP